MNNAGTEIIEDALQVHVPDVYLMRRIYDSLTSVPQVKDVGVESYYASLGLYKSTTTAATYYPGDSITISNVTVENLSPAAADGRQVAVLSLGGPNDHDGRQPDGLLFLLADVGGGNLQSRQLHDERSLHGLRSVLCRSHGDLERVRGR